MELERKAIKTMHRWVLEINLLIFCVVLVGIENISGTDVFLSLSAQDATKDQTVRAQFQKVFELMESTKKYPDMEKFALTCKNWLGVLVSMGPQATQSLLEAELFKDPTSEDQRLQIGELSPNSKQVRDKARFVCLLKLRHVYVCVFFLHDVYLARLTCQLSTIECTTGHEPGSSLFGSSFAVRSEDEKQNVGGWSCQTEGRAHASEAMCLGLFALFFHRFSKDYGFDLDN